ncbi:MAG: 2-oxo acid dehydrogenase subunit E2 [Thaumarchaeota archaeon]|nr:2-oxo acid dehydrogenase subunit E2 [Nitrososphaerota archaeon]
MPKPILVPKLGLTMRKATVVKWLKNEGDQVTKDLPVAVIETEKVSAEIQAPEDGVLLKIFSPKGSVVLVGATIGYVGQRGDAIPDLVLPQQPTVAAAPSASPPSSAPASGEAAPRTRRLSPRARMLAEQKGIDVAVINGTGPGEMVMETDVLEYIKSTLYRTSQGLKVKELIPMSATRRAIAENMTSSLQSMAQVTLTADVLARELEKRVQKGVGDTEHRITYTDVLVKVVAGVLERHPLLNSTLEGDQIKVVEEVNIGVGVAVDTGLVVPVIKDANKKTTEEISVTLRQLAEKARKGGLSMEDITGGTFTITNLGNYGIGAFTPIINPPQSAILGVGRILLKPAVVEGKLAVEPMMTLSLTFDHRIMDGHVAALFLKDLQERIESPQPD